MNSQISSHWRPALGALLMVLSASAVLAQVQYVPLKGSFEGRGTGVVQNGILVANASGAGTASLIGRFSYTLNATVALATGCGDGDFQLVAANRDVITGSFVGCGGPTDTPNVGHIVEVMTITGGTGRFRDATGGFTFDRLVDQTNLPAFDLTSGSLTGTISTPGSTR